MSEFSMINLIRQYPTKMDRELRKELINLYHPFRWTPCFTHSLLEKFLKRIKKYAVIIEFDPDVEDYTFKANLADSLITPNYHRGITHHYPSIYCCSASLTPKAIENLLNNHGKIKKIYQDREIHTLLNVARPAIQADSPALKDVSGKGITIAIVDTGIHPHQDLMGRIKAFKDFTSHKTNTYDDNGHGTHCAGDAAGNGTASKGKYKGIAPEADLVGIKVLNKQGSGSLSTVMAGIQWCLDHQTDYNIKIISMSIGSTASVPAIEDPLVKIVENAWEQGIVVVVAAGNEGPDAATISSPGISPKIITVGAMDDLDTVDRLDDKVADFSSRGPTLDGLVKPDILCPGVNIISLRSPKSYLDKMYKSSRVETDYFTLSGTSMATPICAGVVALMLQQLPNLSPDQVKQILLDTAEDWGLPSNVQGKGYIDAEKAVNSQND